MSFYCLCIDQKRNQFHEIQEESVNALSIGDIKAQNLPDGGNIWHRTKFAAIPLQDDCHPFEKYPELITNEKKDEFSDVSDFLASYPDLAQDSYILFLNVKNTTTFDIPPIPIVVDAQLLANPINSLFDTIGGSFDGKSKATALYRNQELIPDDVTVQEVFEQITTKEFIESGNLEAEIHFESDTIDLFNKRASKVCKVTNSEKSFREKVKALVDDWEPKLQEENLLDEDDRNLLFGNLPDILTQSQQFQTVLDQGGNSYATLIGKEFLMSIPLFEQLTNFIQKYNRINEIFKRKLEDKHFNESLQKAANDFNGTPFETYLLEPLQRFSFYCYYLRKIQNLTPKNHPDFPFINEAVQKFTELQKKLLIDDKESQSILLNLQIANFSNFLYVAPTRIINKKYNISKINENQQDLQLLVANDNVFLIDNDYNCFFNSSKVEFKYSQTDQENVIIFDSSCCKNKTANKTVNYFEIQFNTADEVKDFIKTVSQKQEEENKEEENIEHKEEEPVEQKEEEPVEHKEEEPVEHKEEKPVEQKEEEPVEHKEEEPVEHKEEEPVEHKEEEPVEHKEEEPAEHKEEEPVEHEEEPSDSSEGHSSSKEEEKSENKEHNQNQNTEKQQELKQIPSNDEFDEIANEKMDMQINSVLEGIVEEEDEIEQESSLDLNQIEEEIRRDKEADDQITSASESKEKPLNSSDMPSTLSDDKINEVLEEITEEAKRNNQIITDDSENDEKENSEHLYDKEEESKHESISDQISQESEHENVEEDISESDQNPKQQLDLLSSTTNSSELAKEKNNKNNEKGKEEATSSEKIGDSSAIEEEEFNEQFEEETNEEFEEESFKEEYEEESFKEVEEKDNRKKEKQPDKEKKKASENKKETPETKKDQHKKDSPPSPHKKDQYTPEKSKEASSPSKHHSHHSKGHHDKKKKDKDHSFKDESTHTEIDAEIDSDNLNDSIKTDDSNIIKDSSLKSSKRRHHHGHRSHSKLNDDNNSSQRKVKVHKNRIPKNDMNSYQDKNNSLSPRIKKSNLSNISTSMNDDDAYNPSSPSQVSSPVRPPKIKKEAKKALKSRLESPEGSPSRHDQNKKSNRSALTTSPEDRKMRFTTFSLNRSKLNCSYLPKEVGREENSFLRSQADRKFKEQQKERKSPSGLAKYYSGYSNQPQSPVFRYSNLGPNISNTGSSPYGSGTSYSSFSPSRGGAGSSSPSQNRYGFSSSPRGYESPLSGVFKSDWKRFLKRNREDDPIYQTSNFE